jgi:hypothetical protein
MKSPEETQMISTGLQMAKEYANTIVKGPLSQLGGILSDAIGHWRLRNQVRLILKTKKWLEDNGVEPKPLLPEIFVPLIEDAANIEDETLMDMFASLLKNHLDPSCHEKIHPSYTNVLAQLSPFDARMMLEFRKFTSHTGAREAGLRGSPIGVEIIMTELGQNSRQAYLSCLNLSRLGIIEHMGYRAPDKHPFPSVFEFSPEHQQFLMTEYGVAFCDSCHSKEREDPVSKHPRKARKPRPNRK